MSHAYATQGTAIEVSVFTLKVEAGDRLRAQEILETMRAMRVTTASDATVVQISSSSTRPLAARTDLPTHERTISEYALASLERGIADAKAGRVAPAPSSIFEKDEDEE